MNTETSNKESWLVKSFIEFVSTKGEFSLDYHIKKEGKFNKVTFIDQATQLLFETFIAGKKLNNAEVGHYVIGKFIGSSQLLFGTKPFLHPSKKSATNEIERLLDNQPKDTFVLYQSTGIYKNHE